MYTVLVGHPGLGKGRAINPAVGILRESGCANIMSDKLTIQYILETISRGFPSAQMSPTGGIGLGFDSSCFISAPELQVFLSTSDALPSLAELWEGKDGPSDYGTRGKGLVKISKPCPSLLGGCTPRQIVKSIPNEAIMSGFTRRVNFVYGLEKSRSIPWPIQRVGNDTSRDALVDDLRAISQVSGEFTFDPVAKQFFEKFFKDSEQIDEFADEATATYGTSRWAHALKLAMALTLARGDDLVINFVDMSLAINAINKCYDDLQRVFRAVGDSNETVSMDKITRFLELKGFSTYEDIMSVMYRDVGSTQNLDVMLSCLQSGRVIKAENHGGITVYRAIKQPKIRPQTGAIQ